MDQNKSRPREIIRPLQVLLAAVIGGLVVVTVIRDGFLYLALGLSALVILTIIFVISGKQLNRPALRSGACCFWLALMALFSWEGGKGFTRVLIFGAGAVGFGIIAFKEFRSMRAVKGTTSVGLE